MLGAEADETNGEDRRNNAQGWNLTRLLSRGGRRAPIDDFIFVLRCPEQFARLEERERARIATSNAALRERFSREVLALIVVLQERILIAHGARRTFVDELKAKGITEVNATFLSRRLGGSVKRGPHGEWWLAERIAEHCCHGTSPDELRLQLARLWHAAYGELPKPVQDLAKTLTPLTDEEIAELIDPPPAQQLASESDLPAAGFMNSSDIMTILDGLTHAVLLANAHGIIRYANHAATRLLATDNDTLVGQGLTDLLPAFDMTRLPSSPNAHERQGAADTHPPLRLQARCPDGRNLLVEVDTASLAAYPLPNDGSTDTAIPSALPSHTGHELLMLSMKDLTGTQRLETELARQQRNTDLILRTAGEGILRVDGDARITMANAAAETALGYRLSRLAGQNMAAVLHSTRPDGEVQPYQNTLLGRSLRRGQACSLRGQALRAKDGIIVPVDISATPIARGDHSGGAVITFRVRRPLERSLSLAPAPDRRLEIERAEVSRLKSELTEYHQLLIQVLARLDESGITAVTSLAGALPHTARKDLLTSARAARAGFAVRVTNLTMTAPAGPPASAWLDELVHESVRRAAASSGLARTQCTVFAPHIPLNGDGSWLTSLLARLLAACLPERSSVRPVLIAAAKRDQNIRIDISSTFPGQQADQTAALVQELQAHRGTFHTVTTGQENALTTMVLEIPDTGLTPTSTQNKEPETPPAVTVTPTERRISTRIHINLPGARPLPPIVMPHPTEDRNQPPSNGNTGLQGQTPPRHTDRKRVRDNTSQQAKPSVTAGAKETPSSAESNSSEQRELPPTRLTTGRTWLTITPDGLSQVAPRPGPHPRVSKRGAAERAEVERAAQPPAPPGPTRMVLGLLAREDERERLVRLLARGRSVRLTGPAGSGRTSLLDVVAEDCAGLAPDGVVRLNGFHRTADDLLHELFHAVYNAPLYRPEREELLGHLRTVGAVVVLDDVEFGGTALEELLDATPECAFVIGATPEVAAPSADSAVEEVFLTGLDRADGVELLERAAGRSLTEEEANWAGDLWFESEGLPLRFVQAGALLRRRDRERAGADAVDEFGVFADARPADDTPYDAGEADDVPLPSLGEAAAPAPLLASRLSASARATLEFAVALGGEVPHQAHLPALVGDTHADAALGELTDCGLVSPVASRYRLAADVLTQLESAGYADAVRERAQAAAQHYAWWAGHPSVTPGRVSVESDAVLAALTQASPLTVTTSKGELKTALQLARAAAPAFAAGLQWTAWERALRVGVHAAQLAASTREQAYYHHELGTLMLCLSRHSQAREELDAAIRLHDASHEGLKADASRRTLTVSQHRAGSRLDSAD